MKNVEKLLGELNAMQSDIRTVIEAFEKNDAAMIRYLVSEGTDKQAYAEICSIQE